MAEVSFGEWLKRRRNAAGLTQEQLARQIHCSTSALRKFESELRHPSAPVVEQLAEIFHIPQNERASFLRFARGDWQEISDGQGDAPWQVPHQRAPLRTNLPASTTSFIGRGKEAAEVIDLVKGHRSVTLTGAGGIGKTRLSLQAGSKLLDVFPDGIWMVELASLSTPELIPLTIAATLGLVEQTNRPPETILSDFLSAQKSLLILDNCEHLIQACAQIADNLLRSCPELHILATSREALSIPGEVVYLVPTLTLPDSAHTTLDRLARYEAIQLFVERAKAVLPGFTITRENATAVIQICQHLDGIPLALELAAARLKMLPAEEIAARLDDSFRLLTGGVRTSLPRHQTLQAMIDWSHDLLSEPERILFRRLSVFSGGWTLEAAETVCADPERDDIAPHNVLDLLTALVNKSLILAEHKPGQEVRYSVLETIRQYAYEKMQMAGEEAHVQRRQLAYYVDLAERAEPKLRSFDMITWLDRLEEEHNNIRSALGYAQEENIESQLRLASALLWFWHIRGYKNEGIEWVERALSMEALDRGSRPISAIIAPIRGKALNASGSLMVMNHEFARASMRLKESLALFKELGPAGKRGMAYALLRLGSLLPSGDSEARRLLEQSLAIFREIGDKFGVAECLMQLAGHASSFAQKGDDYSQATLFAEEQLALRREIGDRDGTASALTTLGDLALSQDEYPKAIALYEEALTSNRSVKNPAAESLLLNGYGDVFFQRGDYQRAADIFEEALSLAHKLGYKFIIACNLYNLGVIAWYRGEYSRALQQIEETQSIFRYLNQPWLSAGSLHLAGDIALAAGDEAGAAQWYEAELSFNREAQLKAVHAFALEGLGKVAWSQGDYKLATDHFEAALRMSRAEDIRPATFNALYGLGRTAQAQGEHAAANRFYAEILQAQTRRVVPLFRWASFKTYQSPISYPLAAQAILAVAQNNMPRAARLFGAAENLYTPLRFEMSAKERAEHDQAIASTRAASGEEVFMKLWEEGKKMTIDEAIAYALKED